MSPRPRQPRNRDLPPNLYTMSRGYVYRRPTDRKDVYVGRNRQQAIRDAIEANAYFAAQNPRVARIIGESQTLGTFVDTYFDEISNERGWSSITKRDYQQKLVHILARFADDPGELKEKVTQVVA